MSQVAPQAAARSVYQIRRDLAWAVKEALGLSGQAALPMQDILEFGLPRLLPDFVYDVKSRGEMGQNLGLAAPDDDYICLREDVYDGLIVGDGMDRFTVAHEIGHLILHQRENLVFARGERRLSPLSNPEWQANNFAAEFLMDSRLCAHITDETEMCRRFSVSMSAAKNRIRNIQRDRRIQNQNADQGKALVRVKNPNRWEERT
jgi:hypothetical protein